MAKMIIFCADGTWNGPEQDDNEDKIPDPTNVYKFFLGLDGSLCTDSLLEANEQEKELDENGNLIQIAKYIHGVGDSRNPIRKIIGGAFGAGTISRIVRGYTYISRNYEPGDNIVILGFSRGAYTARALAGLIASKGLLAKHLTMDKEKAYSSGAQAWYQHRSKTSRCVGFWEKLVEAVSNIPEFISKDELESTDFIKVNKIKAVAVWDTVGAMGLPHYIDDCRVDTFQFADTLLSPAVERGFHAVSLDEMRSDFTPTLWDKANNVTQVLFPGAHADVGGGYSCKNNESGLSDLALSWMFDQLKGVGVRLSPQKKYSFNPDVKGTAHKPWINPLFKFGAVRSRDFKKKGVSEHSSVLERMNAGGVIHDPSEPNKKPYAPNNRP